MAGKIVFLSSTCFQCDWIFFFSGDITGHDICNLTKEELATDVEKAEVSW